MSPMSLSFGHERRSAAAGRVAAHRQTYSTKADIKAATDEVTSPASSSDGARRLASADVQGSVRSMRATMSARRW